MLMTLVPLFDENMVVSAYSLFTQKKNHFLNPNLLGTGENDGMCKVEGLEVITSMGLRTLSSNKEVFVPLNSISIFSKMDEQCSIPHDRIVFLIDNTIPASEVYIKRLKELKNEGFKLAIRKLDVKDYQHYAEVISLMDYMFFNHKKMNISSGRIFFSKLYPYIKLCAGNIDTQEIFDSLKGAGGYHYYEGPFYRTPITKGQHEVTPVKINYIKLLNMVNYTDFDLTDAADVIGRDTALVISLLKVVNRMARNSEITSIRHAAAMLGQKELKRWITTVVVNHIYSDKPSEITRLSLLRAKFAENLAGSFNMAMQSSELFLMGLFSVLDLILEKPVKEALEIVKVSKEISQVLIENKGVFAPVYDFVIQYERANWQEVSRLMIIHNIDIEKVNTAYIGALEWYRDLFVDL